MIRTYKRKLKLTKAQEQKLASWIGACRVVYNLGLEVRKSAYSINKSSIHKYELMKQITDLRKDVSWINDVPVNALQNAMQRLDASYKSFFTGKGFPRFASKKYYKSILFNLSIRANQTHIKVPVLGKLKLFSDADIEGKLKSIIIKREPTGFFACIACEVDKPKFQSENQAIGLDMGLKCFCINSNGVVIEKPKHFAKYERKLRIENRSLARKVKRSKSWYRQSKKLALLHHKISNVRMDFLHKQSTIIAKANSVVYIEDLKIDNMAKNHNLSKHILDAGWGMFKTMLEYKTGVVKVNPAYTSQTCFACGEVDKASRISQSEFVCTSCGHVDNADANAAKNIKSQGMALDRQREALACA